MTGTEFWRAVILGAVQGLTEFLPISSKGHLVVFGELLDSIVGKSAVPGGELPLIVALHLGTLLSIVVVFWRELWRLPSQPKLCAWIVLATIPAGLVGLLLKDVLEEAFRQPILVAPGWVFTAGLLWFSQKYHVDRWTLETMRARHAMTIGLFQAMALIPGVSRSGTTIAGGLVSGLSREAAATFSFLMAIPIIAAAALVEVGPLVVDAIRGTTAHGPAPHLLPLVLGAAVAFVVGVAALKGLLQVVIRRQLHWFALYCLVAAVAVTAWQLGK